MADALQDILRVGCAADVEAEALQLVDSLQARLRGIAGQVAKAKRPKVLSLEGLEPLVLGKYLSLVLLSTLTIGRCLSCLSVLTFLRTVPFADDCLHDEPSKYSMRVTSVHFYIWLQLTVWDACPT